MTRATSVSAHVSWTVRLITTPVVGVVVVGLWWAVVASVAHGDWRWPVGHDADTGTAVVAWVVIDVVGPVLSLALIALWRWRVTIGPDRLRTRLLFVSRTLPLARVDSVRFVGGRGWSPTAGPTFDRIEVRGRTAGGRLTGTSINRGFVRGDRAVDALRPWVAARPEIVADDATRAWFAVPEVRIVQGPNTGSTHGVPPGP